MRKIDLTAYEVEREGGSIPYFMRESLTECLFAPQLKINASGLLKRDDLARKIMDYKGDSLLLEEAEYQTVLSSISSIDSFSRDDTEFVRRVLNASETEVVERGTEDAKV